jgi:hypothetical protein
MCVCVCVWSERGRRRKQLLEDLKKGGKNWKLKEIARGHIL